MFESLMVRSEIALAAITTGTGSIEAAAVEDKFRNLRPDFSLLGGAFETWWQKLFGALLAVLIIGSAVYLAIALFKMQAAKDENPAAFSAAKTQAIVSGVALAVFASFGVVLAVFLTVAA